jgi:hypothetical protein
LDHLAKTLQIAQKQQRGAREAPLYSKAMGHEGARPTAEIEVFLPFVAHVFHPFASKPRLGIPHKLHAGNFLVAGNFVAQLCGNLCICNETCANKREGI